MVAILQVSAATYGQKITLSEKNAPLEKVLKKIRSQSGFNFLYEDADIAGSKAVNVEFLNTSIHDALDRLFVNQQLTYSIKDKTVVIKAKAPASNLIAALIDIRGKRT